MNDGGREDRKSRKLPAVDSLQILSEVWRTVVQPIIAELGMQVGNNPPVSVR